MNRLNEYPAQWTVTRSYEHLDKNRPVNIHSVWYPPARRRTAVLGDPSLFCGPMNRLVSAAEAFSHGRPHDHHHYEIVFVVTGSALHTTAWGRCRVGPGSVQVVAPYEVHGYSDVDGMGVIVCAYLGEWLMSDVRDLFLEEGFLPLFLHADLYGALQRTEIPQWKLNDAALHDCVREARDIARECEKPQPSKSYLKSCLTKLMIVLGQAFTESGNTLLHDKEKRVELVLQKIEECVTDCKPLSVAELAANLDVSPSHLREFFHQATGRSPMEYFQWRRVQQASWMLLNTRLSVTEIAHNLGYSDSAHLTHCFKRHRLVTPREYRKRY